MSTVLIGIIGVVLFIGLALAGALILGSDFTSSKNDTKAAAVTQMLQQSASAANMYNLKMGSSISPGLLSNGGARLVQLQPRFLKSAPLNALNTSNGVWLSDQNASGTATTAATVVLMSLGNDVNAKGACDSINLQAGGSATNTTMTALINNMTQQVGCIYTSTTSAGVNVASGDYVAYARI